MLFGTRRGIPLTLALATTLGLGLMIGDIGSGGRNALSAHDSP